MQRRSQEFELGGAATLHRKKCRVNDGGHGRKPAAGENFFWLFTLLYVTFSGLSEKGITPWHRSAESALHLL